MSGQNNITTLSHCPGQMKLQYCGSPVAIRLGATPCSKQMEREGERERVRDREGNHDRCTIPVEKYKVRNPALVPLFVLTAKQKLKWSIHSEKWYRLYGRHRMHRPIKHRILFFALLATQKRLKQAEVMENRERTKQHHNFVTLPRANETDVAIRLGATPCSKQMEREGERERERDREGNHDRCTIPVEKYKVRNPALVPLFVLTAKQKLKWSHLIHSEKWYRLYGQAPYAPAYQTSHPFFCFASHNQKRLKQAEVMENRERTKQHHNFVTLPRANETPILRLSCCHPSGSNSLFETDGERGRERERERQRGQP